MTARSFSTLVTPGADLKLERHLGDLVEKQRALVAARNMPGLSLSAPVNAPRTCPNSSPSTGTVRTLAQRDEAERVVRDLADVRYVSNQLTVGPATPVGSADTSRPGPA